MQSSPSRLGLLFVAAGYAAVTFISALLIFSRYLQYVRYPQDAASAGGMWAGGDLMLEAFIFLLFLVPTAALAWVIRKSEPAYTLYAKALIGLILQLHLDVELELVIFSEYRYHRN